jgi:peptide/nickel transport system ATP-binding protein
MYAGQAVEAGATRSVFDTPAHPYSKGLLASFPSIRGPRVPLTGIQGSPPDLADLPSGCHFNPRCPSATQRCTTDEPLPYDVNGVLARCHLHDPAVTR